MLALGKRRVTFAIDIRVSNLFIHQQIVLNIDVSAKIVVNDKFVRDILFQVVCETLIEYCTKVLMTHN